MSRFREVWSLGIFTGLVLALLPGTAAAVPPGSVEFTVLSYNIHGLPGWVAGDEPEQRMPKIARRLADYDVALLQEDWNHHELLVNSIPHSIVERGFNPEPSWFQRLFSSASSSGLTALARMSESQLLAIQREPYGTCSGWITGANDCWSSKGTLLLRLRLAYGLEVDFVDTHLDAGNGPDDREVRHDQLDRLEQRLRRESEGRALIVAGDFNMNAADPEEALLLRRFAERLGLTDCGIEPGPPWKRIDYIYFRGGRDASLELVEARMEEDFVWEGGALSDHPALSAHFRGWAHPATDE